MDVYGLKSEPSRKLIKLGLLKCLYKTLIFQLVSLVPFLSLSVSVYNTWCNCQEIPYSISLSCWIGSGRGCLLEWALSTYRNYYFSLCTYLVFNNDGGVSLISSFSSCCCCWCSPSSTSNHRLLAISPSLSLSLSCPFPSVHNHNNNLNSYS